MLVKISDFKNFLKQLLENNIGQFKDIIVPARAPDAKNNNTILASVRDGKEIILDHYRTIDPVKIMFYHTRELLTNTNCGNQERIHSIRIGLNKSNTFPPVIHITILMLSEAINSLLLAHQEILFYMVGCI